MAFGLACGTGPASCAASQRQDTDFVGGPRTGSRKLRVAPPAYSLLARSVTNMETGTRAERLVAAAACCALVAVPFLVVDFPPVTPEAEAIDNEALVHAMGASKQAGSGAKARHSYMHRTRTIHYAIVLEGEIDMLLDDCEVHLKAGEVVVQQGTNHAWVNRGSRTCRMAFVLIDANEPPSRKND